MPYPLYTPAGEDPTEAWIAPEFDEAALRYGSNVVITYTPWPAGTDPAQRYEQQRASLGVGYTTQINGYPTWVVEEGSNEDGTPRANKVHISIDGVDITLYGLVPVEELRQKAERLEA